MTRSIVSLFILRLVISDCNFNNCCSHAHFMRMPNDASAKYFKMLKMGVSRVPNKSFYSFFSFTNLNSDLFVQLPKEAVKHAMMRDQLETRYVYIAH